MGVIFSRQVIIELRYIIWLIMLYCEQYLKFLTILLSCHKRISDVTMHSMLCNLVYYLLAKITH